MNILTVSQLNLYTRSVLDGDKNLQNVFVTGEISNLTNHYKSGHIYLSLKDSSSVIKAVMFAGNAAHLKFRPFDGLKIIARGRVSLYEATGAYQFYIEDMQPEQIGALSLAFEQLKAKLNKAGLFDPENKRRLPPFPETVGVITSPSGAAVHDITNILKRRFPAARVLFYPAAVQGDGAAEQLCNAVRYLNADGRSQVIIIGRGGGSIEDLWAFNDEQLAYEIYNSAIPVISAVGHETDFTICDFVADVRASTPSAAAELAVPNTEQLLSQIELAENKLEEIIKGRFSHEYDKLETIVSSNAIKNPLFITAKAMTGLYSLNQRLNAVQKKVIADKKAQLSNTVSKLYSMDPLKVLTRGYSVASKNGVAVSSVDELNTGDSINVRLTDGTAECTVLNIEKTDFGKAIEL